MSVNVTDTDDVTPLHISAWFGNVEATNVFVKKRAALNNAKNFTPLMVR